MVTASVGQSRYGDLRGVEQFIEAGAAYQLNLLLDHVATLPGCYRPTVNEGIRPYDRAVALWKAYQSGSGVLAANPYPYPGSSTHRPEIGNAADLGGPDGEVLSAPVLAAIRSRGPAYGVFATGMGFVRPELWHFNVYPARAIIRTAGAQFTTTNTDRPEEDDDMKPLFIIGTQKSDQKEVIDYFLVNPQEFTYIHMENDVQKDFWINLGATLVNGAQPPTVLDNFTPIKTTGPR